MYYRKDFFSVVFSDSGGKMHEKEVACAVCPRNFRKLIGQYAVVFSRI